MVSHSHLYGVEGGIHRGYLYAHGVGTARTYVRDPDTAFATSGIHRFDGT
jgi:hypothetical protein